MIVMRAGSYVLLVTFAAVALLFAFGRARFRRRVLREVRELFTSAAKAASVVEASELERLPVPVRRWLITSGVVGRERARTVRLRQRGQIRTSPEGAWMPATAEQWFAVDPPGFVWLVDATMAHALPFVGRDMWADGKGRMEITLGGLAHVVNADGPKIDQGAMLRYLGEIVWFPSAALDSRITWRAIDDNAAEATFTHAGQSVTADFMFGDDGRVLGLRAERFMGTGEDAKLTAWFVPCTEWRVIRGIEVPVRGTVAWKLPHDGEFEYYRWQILDVIANPRPVRAPTGAASDASRTQWAHAHATGRMR